MRENCTYGSMRGSRRKTAKSVLRVVEDRAGVPDKGRSALLYTLCANDDETVAFCVAVLSAAENNETIKSGINTRVTHSAVFDYNRREAVFRRDDDAVAGGPRTALRRPTRLKPVRDIPVKSEILV